MEQNKEIRMARSKIRKVMKTLKNAIRYDEAIDALILGLVAREDVMLVGPRGMAFNHLMQMLTKLIATEFTKLTSYDVQRPSSDILFVEITPNSGLQLRSIERRDAWILIATVEEAEDEVPHKFVKAFVQHLYGRDLISAVKTKWLRDYMPIASMRDVRTLHEYAVSLLKRENIVKSYCENVVTLVETLRVKHITIGDEHVIETLPKLYAAYLAIHGASPENTIGAAYEILPYIAQTREEQGRIKKIIDESLGDVAELIRLLNDGKQQLEIGDVRGALEMFREVATYNPNLPPGLKQNAEDLINAANKYIEKIQNLST
jgi:DNA-directed RNA polymerase subunit L